MYIKTPTSILGVRGTTFAVEIAGPEPAAADRASAAANCRLLGEGAAAPAAPSAAAEIVAAGAAGVAPAAEAAPSAAATAGTPVSAPQSPGGTAAPAGTPAAAGAASPADTVGTAACATAGSRPAERYVVLPNADGRAGSGAITVHRGDTATTLDQPYAAAELENGQATATATTMDAAQTLAIFQPALAARPMLPAHFRVQFPLDSDEMTPESAAIYASALADIKKRQTYEIDLIGYTDTLADEAHNQRLSVRRAEAVRRALVADGIDPKTITVEGRGEAEQLVQTAAGVAEPRNRRVEITIR